MANKNSPAKGSLPVMARTIKETLASAIASGSSRFRAFGGLYLNIRQKPIIKKWMTHVH